MVYFQSLYFNFVVVFFRSIKLAAARALLTHAHNELDCRAIDQHEGTLTLFQHLLAISEVIEILCNDFFIFLLVQDLITGLCAQSDVAASVMVTSLDERSLGAKGSRSQMDLSVIMPKGKRTPKESAPKQSTEPTPVLRERQVKAAKAKPDPRAKELEKALKM